MRTILLGAALAALPAAAFAQGDAPATPAPACYIEVSKLMAEPPAGIGEIAAAIRAIEAALRPQAVEINGLKAQLARLEQREAAPAPSGSLDAAFAEEEEAPRAATSAPGDPNAEEVTRLQAEIAAKQARLRTDYAAQKAALLDPVQARISRGAQAFATTSRCAELKMARAPDIAGLTAAGARNVTGEFVAWYLANPPA